MNDPLAITNPIDADDAALDATIDFRPESTIVGDYELLEEVARGGMGVVYKAQQRSLERTVALKLILTGGDASEEELARFKLEAQAAARLDHPNIVPVYGLGQLEGRPFISMGFVSGPSLSVRISRQGKLEPFEAALLIQKAAEALHYAHQQGVVHRDIKPGNILIDEDGEPQITDFGLAKRQDAEHSLTATGQVLGTPTYMPPEQAAGLEVGPAGDIYSLGATLYTALVGKPPFDSSSLVELLVKLAEEAPVPPHQRDAEIPEALSNICLRCLAKKPEDRYATGQELADDLSRFLAGKALKRASLKSPRKKFGMVAGIAVTVLLAIAAWTLRGSISPFAMNANQLGLLQADSVSDAGNRSLGAISQDASTSVADQTLLKALVHAEEMLVPDVHRPLEIWNLRYTESAAAHRTAFEAYGLQILSTDPELIAERLKGRPESLREAVIQGMERWELAATAAKLSDAVQLRAVQQAMDSSDWRRNLCLLREDNNASLLMSYLNELDVSALEENQFDLLALMVWVYSEPNSDVAQSVLKKLCARSPPSFWPNMLLGAAVMKAAGAQPNERESLAAQAVASLRTAAAARPQAAAVHVQLASVFDNLNNETMATRERDVAAHMVFPEAWPLVLAARKAREDKDYSLAVDSSQQAIAISPSVPFGATELAAALMLNGQSAKAESVLQQIAETAPSEWAAFWRLCEACRLADPVTHGVQPPLREFLAASRARNRAVEHLIRFRPNLTGEGWDIGFGFAMDDRVKIECIRKAVELTPDHKIFFCRMVRLLYERNMGRDVLLKPMPEAFWEDTDYGPHLHTAVAWTFAREGRVADGLDYFRQMFERWPKEGYPTYRAARFREFLWAFDCVDRGLPLLEAYASTSGSPEVAGELTLAYLGAGQDIKAQSILGVDTNPNFLRSLRHSYGLGLCTAGSVEQVIPLGLQAIEANPRDWQAYPALALALALSGAFEESQQMITIARELVAERWGAALTDLQQSRQRSATIFDHNGGEFLHDLGFVGYTLLPLESTAGRILLSAGNTAKASEVLSDAYQAAPIEHGYHGLGGGAKGWTADYVRTLVRLDELEKAELVAAELLSIRPEEGAIHWAVGLLRQSQGRTEEAVSAMQTARRLDPLNGLISADLGLLLLQRGEWKDALAELERAVDMYQKRRIREFRPVPFEVSVAVLEAINQEVKPLNSKGRDLLGRRAFDWLRYEIGQWREKVKGPDSIKQSSAAQVVRRVLTSELPERARNDRALSSLPGDLRQPWLRLWDYLEPLEKEAGERIASYESGPLDAAKSPDLDRKVAEWVLSKGGTVLIWQREFPYVDQPVGLAKDLPLNPFRTTAVSFSKCEVGDADLEMLPTLTSLSQLHLDDTNVTNQGVKKIAARIPTLRLLNLENCRISDEGVESLTGFNELYLRKTSVTAEMVTALQTSNPSALILSDMQQNQNFPMASNSVEKNSFAAQMSGKTTVPFPFTYESSKPITVEAWVKLPTQIHSSNMNIINGRRWESERYTAWFTLKARNVRDFNLESLRPNGGITVVPGNHLSALIPDQAVHLAGIYDGKEYRSYVNGKVSGKLSDFQPMASSLTFEIAKSEPMGFFGTIDEVRISSVCRYTDDFEPVRRHEPDEHTLVLYHFDEGEGDTIHDSSGNERHAKIIGEVKWIPEEEFGR